MLTMIGNLFLEVQSILKDGYEQYALSSTEKEGLKDFRNRYKNFPNLILTDVGFEDYYLIYDLYCQKHNIDNTNKVIIKEAIRSFFLHSIYNKGEVNNIYKYFPSKLLDFFNSFDNIFTTNYDRNIEVSCGKNIFYLHGAFHIKNDDYNPESLRNKLSKKASKDYKIDEKFFYLYSNALTDYSGMSKKFSIIRNGYANSSIEKMAKGYVEKETIRKDIDSWEKSNNIILNNLYESVMLKLKFPQLKFDETYPFEEFQGMEGSVEILGLSPNNDTHIFEGLNRNSKITNVVYYYYDLKEKEMANNLLNNKSVRFVNVMELWRGFIMNTKMKENEFHKFAEVFRSLTGSCMKDIDILNAYNAIDNKKRMQLFDKIHEIIQERNMPFDKALPLITVELNVLAAEEQIDPAILLFTYIDNFNKK